MEPVGRLIVIALAIALLVAPKVAADDRSDIAGTIICAESGVPIENASITLYTAKPREGAGTLCPSCHEDCGRRATTNADGEFLIESADASQIFRALVLREGHHPAFANDIDPRGEPVEVKLVPLDLTLPAERTVRGRVVDEDGQPIVGAWVQPSGRYRPTRTTAGRTYMGGIVHGPRLEIDALAATNEKGEFTLICGEAAFSVEAYLKNSRMDPQAAALMFCDLKRMKLAARFGAPGFARKIVLELEPGGEMNEVVLRKGVTIIGRVVAGRTPLDGVEIGFVQAQRSPERFLGEMTIGTREDGTFEIANLPADEELFIYGKIESLGERGALPPRSFRTGREGELLDLGDLRVRPAHTIRGRVVLSDGGEIPTGSQLLVSRERAWDLLRISIEVDGSFVIRGLPQERISISHRVPDYHISLRNPSYEALNYRLGGRVEGDLDEFVILLEPGRPDPEAVAAIRNARQYATGAPDDPNEQPLRGYSAEE